MAQKRFRVGDRVKVVNPDPESPWLMDNVGLVGRVIEVDFEKYGRQGIDVQILQGNPVRPVASSINFCPEELRKVGYS